MREFVNRSEHLFPITDLTVVLKNLVDPLPTDLELLLQIAKRRSLDPGVIKVLRTFFADFLLHDQRLTSLIYTVKKCQQDGVDNVNR